MPKTPIGVNVRSPQLVEGWPEQVQDSAFQT